MNLFSADTINICGAKTGRVISTEPNLNSTPRDPVFRKPNEGNRFIICDYSMIEIIIIATEKTMLENIYKGKDLHIFLATKILHRTYEELMDLKNTNPKEFKRIRNFMFGLLYGMGYKTINLWNKVLYTPKKK